MKALTILQPWATLIAIGAKQFETRSWKTNYRGPIAIHAGQSQAWCFMAHGEPFNTVLREAGYLISTDKIIPRGAIVAIAELVDCHLIGEGGEIWRGASQSRPKDNEKAFGDWSPGRFAWRLENVQALDKPIPAKGKQGLWNWDGEAIC